MLNFFICVCRFFSILLNEKRSEGRVSPVLIKKCQMCNNNQINASVLALNVSMNNAQRQIDYSCSTVHTTVGQEETIK